MRAAAAVAVKEKELRGESGSELLIPVTTAFAMPTLFFICTDPVAIF